MKATVLKRWLGAILLSFLLTESAHAFYNPELGRWVIRDPLGEPGFETIQHTGERSWHIIAEVDQGPNLFTFLRNNSVNFTDEDGLRGGPVYTLDCAKRIADEVGKEYCAGPNPKRAPDDPDCREAHCIASCRIARECYGGAIASFGAGWWREIDRWQDDSWGDAWANTKGICKAFNLNRSCEETCKGVR